MSFSKTGVTVLLLLLGIIGAEFYYFKHKTGESKKGTQSEKSTLPDPWEQNITEGRSLPSKTNNTVIEKEKDDIDEDQNIISIVESYQKGYKEGCQKISDANSTSVPAETDRERAYLLGFEKGKTECLLVIRQKKEHYDLGYKDGCNSAIGKAVKNTALYDSSVDYKKGWERGAEKCDNKRKKATVEESKGKEKKVNERSQEYQSGYRHGCSSAKGNYTREEDVYLHSRAYREGWTLGRQKCKNIRNKSAKKSLTPTQKRHYFDQGYRDGCDSVRGFYRRDPYKYTHIGSYAEGWRAGEYECAYY
ncbi:MAG: hypothetical protein U9R26_11020 [Campylobacterota bacterium]|nr:hypothetical protein [Campylobacterota bacterium]